MEERDPATTNGPISADERTYLIDTLRTTRDALRQSVQGLTNAQQQYQPAPDRWSITQCVEHIFLVEKGILRAIQSAMDTAADPDKRASIKVSDLYVVKAVRSRGMAVSAPAPFVPMGRFNDVSTAMTAFESLRADTLTFAETAPADLRLHYFQHLFLGTLDTYQAILVIASHGERHRKQIDEVKASACYPL